MIMKKGLTVIEIPNNAPETMTKQQRYREKQRKMPGKR